MRCFLCGREGATEQSHHILPRSRGGEQGPEVVLCSDHHMAVHSAAKAMQRGKSPERFLADLTDVGRSRAMGLVQVILMAELQGASNPHPLLAVSLDCPEYLTALKRFQHDHGYSSQAKAVNAILRTIALRYALVGGK